VAAVAVVAVAAVVMVAVLVAHLPSSKCMTAI
jgi:hypothetical protein